MIAYRVGMPASPLAVPHQLRDQMVTEKHAHDLEQRSRAIHQQFQPLLLHRSPTLQQVRDDYGGSFWK